MKTAYQSFATLSAVSGRHLARAWVVPVQVSEDDDDDDDGVFSATEEQAWAACEAALQMMASECLREAGGCRARAKGVQRGVA